MDDPLTPRNTDPLARNMPYVNTANMRPWNTPLPPLEEALFRAWLRLNNVPFNPNRRVTDYDMRGYWQAMMRGDDRAKTEIDPNDNRVHWPDYWKTPLHETFSDASQWALPTAPRWNDEDQLIAPSGKILFDDKKQNDREQN